MLITFHADESFREEKIHSWMGELVTICNSYTSYTEVEIAGPVRGYYTYTNDI